MWAVPEVWRRKPFFPLTPSRAEVMEGPEKLEPAALERGWGYCCKCGCHRKGKQSKSDGESMTSLFIKHWVQNRLFRKGKLGCVSKGERRPGLGQRGGRELTVSIILLRPSNVLDCLSSDSCDNEERQHGGIVTGETGENGQRKPRVESQLSHFLLQPVLPLPNGLTSLSWFPCLLR